MTHFIPYIVLVLVILTGVALALLLLYYSGLILVAWQLPFAWSLILSSLSGATAIGICLFFIFLGDVACGVIGSWLKLDISKKD